MAGGDVNDRAWEDVLGALAQETARLEKACAEGMGEILALARGGTTAHPFEPPQLDGTIPPHLVDAAIALSQRLARVQGEIEQALKLTAQGLAVSHELARSIPDGPPHFIDASL